MLAAIPWLGGFLACALSIGVEETPIEAPIVRVALFKNGLAVIDRRVTVPGPGRYRLDSVPTPAHGTFWVESDARVLSRVESRDVEVPIEEADSFYQEIVGRRAVIFFRDGRLPPAEGLVQRWIPFNNQNALTFSPGQAGHLVLETETGRTYVDTSSIVSIRSDGHPSAVAARRPVLLFDVEGTGEGGSTLRIQYLANGLSWAPSYRIDTSDPKRLHLEQSAVLLNELEDLDQVEVELISGFPNLEFARITSPLAAQSTWTDFFQQLQAGGAANSQSIFGNRMMTQQAITSNFAPAMLGPVSMGPLDPEREGVDMHYQPIGRVDLAKGASLNLSVATGGADYERIVSWTVPDVRDSQGRRRRGSDSDDDGSPWDALRFRNPLKIPMTTAPALVVASGQLLGQSASLWVNPGGETTLRVTKALSVQTRSIELEREGSREIVYVGADDFWRTEVDGELVVRNYRTEPVTLEIRRRFSGELIQSSETAETRLLEEGVATVNRRSELVWRTTLEAGEEHTWTYRYRVLVNK